MSLLDKLKNIFKREEIVKEKKIQLTPEEFEKFLESGGKMEYASLRIENLEDRIKSISEHPIQKKVIDYELFIRIIDILKELDVKVSVLPEVKSRVDGLPTLEDIYSTIKEMLPEVRPESKKKLEQIVGMVESELDERYLEFLSKVSEATASELANDFKISRNTASERLNRLVELGKVKKTRKNRKVYFRKA